MSLALMEETYATFAQFNLDIPREDTDRVDSLRYNFKNMLEAVSIYITVAKIINTKVLTFAVNK